MPWAITSAVLLVVAKTIDDSYLILVNKPVVFFVNKKDLASNFFLAVIERTYKCDNTPYVGSAN